MKSRCYYYRIYKHFLKDKCEDCQSTSNLVVHHIDEDISNNMPHNLKTLCRRCHQVEHKCWKNLPDRTGMVKIPLQRCIKCDKEFRRRHGHLTQKYCSQACYLGVIKEKNCEWCKKTFKCSAGYPKQRFCSLSCSAKNSNFIRKNS